MKAVLRIPCAEQYAYIEIELDKELTPEEIVDEYRRHTQALKVGEGISEKEMDTFVQNQLAGNNRNNKLSTFQAMSLEQQNSIQRNKRAMARINRKLEQAENQQ